MQNYYHIISQQKGDSSAEFVVELLQECPVYEGHFPGNPIAPGACNIEMIRECASLIFQRDIRISSIQVCKFMMLLRPCDPPTLTIQFTWQLPKLQANVIANGQVAMQLKMNIL